MIRYTFRFEREEPIVVVFDEDQERSRDITTGRIPAWLELERGRCDDCSLAPASRRTCPAAVALRPIVEAFRARHSYEKVHVHAQVRDVSFEWLAPTQRAVRSVMELALALSACPVMSTLRPLAYLHVPFTVPEYNAFRFLGMHFITQYLKARDGLEPDWQLGELRAQLRKIRRVYATLAQRVRAAADRDASINSLLLLDAFTDAIELGVERNLDNLRKLFRVPMERAHGEHTKR